MSRMTSVVTDENGAEPRKPSSIHDSQMKSCGSNSPGAVTEKLGARAHDGSADAAPVAVSIANKVRREISISPPFATAYVKYIFASNAL